MDTLLKMVIEDLRQRHHNFKLINRRFIFEKKDEKSMNKDICLSFIVEFNARKFRNDTTRHRLLKEVQSRYFLIKEETDMSLLCLG